MDEKSIKMLTVKEVADLFQVSTKSVKRFEDTGLLTPIRINKRGDRRYRFQDVWDVYNKKGVFSTLHPQKK